MYIYRGVIDPKDQWNVHVSAEGVATYPLPIIPIESPATYRATMMHWGDNSVDTWQLGVYIIAHEYARDFGTDAAEEFAVPVGTTFGQEVLGYLPVLKQRERFYMNWEITSQDIRNYVSMLSNGHVYESYEKYRNEAFKSWLQKRNPQAHG